MASSPVVARWELSRRLGNRRRELKVDVKTITDALGFSRNYWSAVENDRTLIAEDKLRLLFDVLDFPESDQAELLQLREDSRKRGWWDEYPSLDDLSKRFYGMEAGADRIRSYEGHFIPGVLQIPEYSQSIFEADPFRSPIDIEPSIAVRRRRQSELLGRPRPRIEVILSEAALRQQVSGPEVQTRQLSYLLELDESDRISLRILPFSTNPGMIVSSSTLTFLEYEQFTQGAVAFQEAVRNFEAIDRSEELYRALDTAWHDASSRSIDREAARRMIRSIQATLSAPTD